MIYLIGMTVFDVLCLIVLSFWAVKANAVEYSLKLFYGNVAFALFYVLVQKDFIDYYAPDLEAWYSWSYIVVVSLFSFRVGYVYKELRRKNKLNL